MGDRTTEGGDRGLIGAREDVNAFRIKLRIVVSVLMRLTGAYFLYQVAPILIVYIEGLPQAGPSLISKISGLTAPSMTSSGGQNIRWMLALFTLFQFCIGAYLLFGGRWLLDRVFSAPSHES